MHYRASCPNCGTKVSRQDIFGRASWHHPCRCGSKLGNTPGGWILLGSVVALEIASYALYRMHVLSPLMAASLLVLILGLSVWLLPYFTPLKIVSRSSPGS